MSGVTLRIFRASAALSAARDLVDDVGQGNSVTEEAGDHTAAATVLHDGLGHRDHVAKITARAAHLFGETNPQDARSRRTRMQ